MIKKLSIAIFIIFLFILSTDNSYAQSCQGSASYQHNQAECQLNQATGLYSCRKWTENRSEPCGVLGACVAVYEEYTRDCQFNSSRTSCSVYVVFRDEHVSSGSCYWTSPPSSSTPPTAAPEPPQQGWGGCGSCSGCLGPDPRDPSECVRAPDGSCHWDPGKCAGGGGGGGNSNDICRIREISGPQRLKLGETITVGLHWTNTRSSWRDSVIEVKDLKPDVLRVNPTRKNICCGAGGNGHDSWDYFKIYGNSIGEDLIRFKVEVVKRDNEDSKSRCEKRRQFNVDPPTPPTECQLQPAPGRTILPFTGKHISNVQGETNRTDGPFTTVIPQGNYTVTVQTYDTHDAGSTSQANERARLIIRDRTNTSLVAQTGYTDDIPDNEQHRITTMASTMNIPTTNTYAYSAEIFDPTNVQGAPQSVNVVCAALDPAACSSVSNLTGTATSCAPAANQNSSITWNWTAPAGTTGYQVRVKEVNSGVVVHSANVTRSATCSGNNCSYTANVHAGEYIAEVTATGAGCSTSSVVVSSPVTSSLCTYQKSGIIYQDDPDNRATSSGLGDVCVGSTANPVQPGASSFVYFESAAGGASAPINSNGTYSAQVPGSGSAYSATLNIGGEYLCSCPQGCTLSATGATNQSNLNFYVTLVDDPWYQVGGGDVHANATSFDPDSLYAADVFTNPIPKACEESGSCKPYSIITNAINNPAGLLTLSGGLIDTSRDEGKQTNRITEGNESRFGITQFSKAFNSYENFYQWAGLGFNPTPALYGNTKPTNGVHYYAGGLTINETWDVSSGEKITIIVDGDLTFGPAARMQVAEGGFLGFIVKGNMSFDREIGQDDPASNESVMEGFFLAGGTVTIEGNLDDTPDKKFHMEGSLIGWGGVNFNRDFRGIINNSVPVISIDYRPDLILNAPHELKHSKITWRTRAP